MFNFILGLILGAIFSVPLAKAAKWAWDKIKELLAKKEG